jgi:hypothetical protein
MAIARVRWFTEAAGGRHEPPQGPTYAATAVFVLGGDAELVPGWPAGGEHFSVLLDFDETSPEGESLAKIEFMSWSLVADRLLPGSAFLIMEGPKPVAEARVNETFDTGVEASP